MYFADLSGQFVETGTKLLFIGVTLKYHKKKTKKKQQRRMLT